MKQQKDIGRIMAVSITCKDCGTVFVMGQKEVNWYAQKMGWPLPKRCPECRKKRREAKKDATSGILQKRLR